MTQALLLVDHGSRRKEANENLDRAAEAIRKEAPELMVVVAHMELAEPTIDTGFEQCAEAGVTELVVFPWFLAEGRHVKQDIPELCEAASKRHKLPFRLAPPFGVDVLMAKIALARAGLNGR